MNGHVAMNEPGTSKNIRSHISTIAKDTQEVGQKYFKNKNQYSEGLTLGIGTLLGSKHIMLMVTGSKKAFHCEKVTGLSGNLLIYLRVISLTILKLPFTWTKKQLRFYN
jgi:6-phosphogluconolactonase/glucosamine-6-phosphate isomerase/deaminase